VLEATDPVSSSKNFSSSAFSSGVGPPTGVSPSAPGVSPGVAAASLSPSVVCPPSAFFSLLLIILGIIIFF